MNFETAQSFVMPFGKHRGQTLDDIASTDDGLLYLDYLLGEMSLTDSRPVAKAIDAYLSDDSIRSDLEALVYNPHARSN